MFHIELVSFSFKTKSDIGVYLISDDTSHVNKFSQRSNFELVSLHGKI